MIVQALRAQHLRQLPLVPRGLLQLGPLVLEPDLDLVLVQAQLLQRIVMKGMKPNEMRCCVTSWYLY